MGKSFEKQIKTTEDQGQNQIDALENLKPKKETKPTEDKSKKKIVSKLYDSVDYNKLKFEFLGSAKDVSFYEYKDSKELFNATKKKPD